MALPIKFKKEDFQNQMIDWIVDNPTAEKSEVIAYLAEILR